jgi:hypothetical protein
VHQDHPVPHTLRYSVGDNRIDIVLEPGAPYGGFANEPCTDDSTEHVFVARRITPAP